MSPDLHVLVPHDGSGLSEAILPLLSSLGPRRLTLVRVVDGATSAEEPRKLGSAAERDLARVAERLGLEGFPEIGAIVRAGRAADEILEAALESRAHLIAMTTHGSSGFDRLVLGSTAEKVIRAAQVPVLALRPEKPAPGPGARLFEQVLVPLDGSDLAARGLETVARFAPRGTRVVLLGVVESFEVSGPAPGDGARRGDLAARFLELRVDGLRTELERAAERAQSLGLEATTRVDVGLPAERVLRAAESLPASLIAMATHGRSGLTRWALGSVTEKVLRAATVPLLICR